MVFELLNPKLQELVKKRFKEPTLPQKLAIPKILEGKNVLLISKTGTGKTESVMLPIFNFLTEKKLNPIAALYITPLKALNRDLLDRLIWWANKLEIDISVRHGDTSKYERRMQTEFPPLLLISTLETLQPILVGKKIREHLKNVKWVILDEVHESVDSKRGIQLALALTRLKQLCKNFQLIMISATIGEPEKVAKFFAGNEKVEIIKAITSKEMDIKVICPEIERRDREIATKIFSSIDAASRIREIINLVKDSNSTLIFTNTREFAEILTSRIKSYDKNFPVEVHHSSLGKNVRIRVEKEFRDQKLKGIVCTSSLQLGIDIGSVDLIIQYMSPRQVTQLIQRIGRSGHRIEKISKGIILPVEEDDIFESAVIARKAMNEELERIKPYKKSYDVLAHQIIGLALEYGRPKLEEIFKIVKNAEPYKELSYKEFLEVCKLLEKIGIIFLNEEIRKRRRSFEYYFENLSTIPSIKQYKIVNAIDKSIIGNLDDEFVALYASEGTSFIVKGEAWKILSIEDDKVIVEPTQDIEAAIPAWEGELIPVPFEVAQEVGLLRRKIAENLENEEKLNEVLSTYPINEKCKRKMINLIKRQKKFGIPDEKTILIEDSKDIFVLHCCFGSTINEALSKFLASFISSRVGLLKIKSDPYRIILEIKGDKNLIKEAFQVDPKHVRFYIQKSIENSELFKWRFLHVAKRFGIIKENVKAHSSTIKRIIEEYSNSPVYKETLREIETEKIDVDGAIKVLKKVKNGEIKIKFIKGLSPIAKLGLRGKFGEVFTSPRKEILDIFKKRILNSKVSLICLNCGNWYQTYKVKDIPSELKCRKCGAKLISIAKKFYPSDLKIVKKYLHGISLKRNEIRRLRYLKSTAELFLVYGKKAAIALSAKGIGPETAKRILAKRILPEDNFYKEILKAEKLYIQTKKFWKV